jgi:hypothetical protein
MKQPSPAWSSHASRVLSLSVCMHAGAPDPATTRGLVLVSVDEAAAVLAAVPAVPAVPAAAAAVPVAAAAAAVAAAAAAAVAVVLAVVAVSADSVESVSDLESWSYAAQLGSRLSILSAIVESLSNALGGSLWQRAVAA